MRRAALARALLLASVLAPAGCTTASPAAADLALQDEPDLALLPDLVPTPDLITGPVTRTVGFDVPESAYFHAPSDAWYVSNMSLTDFNKLAVKDGKGWISKLDKDGKVLEARWFETGLSTPAGIRATPKGQLVVVNIDELVFIDPATKAAQRVAVPGAGLLNDVDVAADGTVYATDTFTNTIWSYASGGTPQRLVQDDRLNLPNGILALPSRLLIASTGPFDQPMTRAELWGFSLEQKALTMLGFQGKLDGMERDDMALLVSENPTARVYRVAIGEAPRLLRDFQALDGLKSAGDIGFDPARRRLAVPDLQGNAVAFVTVP